MTTLSNYYSEAKKTLKFATPLIISQVVQMAIITVDSVMAGWDSDLTLAAISQGAVLWEIVILILVGILMPMTARVARAYTQNDGTFLRESFQQALWLAMIMSVLGTGLMLLIPNVMSLTGVKPAIIEPATQYLYITAITIPFVAFFLPLRFLSEGVGNTKLVLFVNLIAIPINIVGNTLFIYGFLGFPKMGVTGIAISSVISEIVMCLAMFYYVCRNSRFQSFQLFKDFARPKLAVLTRYLQLGIPNALALLMEIGMFACVVLLSGRLGVTEAAATQVAFNYSSNMFMIPLGISMALSTRIGMAMGENNLPKARVIGLSGIFLGAAVMSFSVILIPFFGEDIARLFSKDLEVVQVATTLLFLAAISQTFDGTHVCSAGALRGLEDTKSPMLIALVGYWLLAIPLAIALAFYLGFSVQGLWTGLIVGLTTAGILGFLRFYWVTRNFSSLLNSAKLL